MGVSAVMCAWAIIQRILRIQDALQNSQRVVDLLERVLEFNHRDFEARTLLIKHLRLQRRNDEADELAKVQSRMIANRQRCRELRTELDEKPRNIDKRCELAELCWYTESVAEAKLLISEILELDPNCERANQLLARINAEQNGRTPPP